MISVEVTDPKGWRFVLSLDTVDLEKMLEDEAFKGVFKNLLDAIGTTAKFMSLQSLVKNSEKEKK
jgi:hypothetical protein